MAKTVVESRRTSNHHYSRATGISMRKCGSQSYLPPLVERYRNGSARGGSRDVHPNRSIGMVQSFASLTLTRRIDMDNSHATQFLMLILGYLIRVDRVRRALSILLSILVGLSPSDARV